MAGVNCSKNKSTKAKLANSSIDKLVRKVEELASQYCFKTNLNLTETLQKEQKKFCSGNETQRNAYIKNQINIYCSGNKLNPVSKAIQQLLTKEDKITINKYCQQRTHVVRHASNKCPKRDFSQKIKDLCEEAFHGKLNKKFADLRKTVKEFCSKFNKKSNKNKKQPKKVVKN